MIRLSYDLHIHSCLSPCGDDDSTPANIVGMAALIGLDAIAVADHNTCANLPAVMKAAEEYGVIAVPAMEMTTSEEVHVLCYFRTLEDAMAFSDHVADHSLHIDNKPEFFGRQLLYSEDDELLGEERRLLHAATDISFDHVNEILRDYHGLMVPAHINKSTTSVLSNLGFLPEDSDFTAVEIQTVDRIAELTEQYPYLQGCHILTSSDAHQLQDIQEAEHILHVQERSVDGIIDALSHYIQEE